MKKQLKIYAEEINVEKIKYIAKMNRRNNSAEIEIALEKYIAEYEAQHGEIITHESGQGGGN